jgi:ABC-type nitrate/sulfonate/bicarbonate transport system substrate-binding protein
MRSNWLLEHMRRKVVWGVCMLVAIGALSGCGDGDEGDSAAAGGAAEVPTLNIATASVSAPFVPVWIAIADDLFTKHKVDVNVVNYQATAVQAALLTSGQADLIVSNNGSLATLANQGQPVRIVVDMGKWSDRTQSFVSVPSVNGIEELQKLGSKCTIGTTGVGTGYYGYGLIAKEQFDLGCKIQAFADVQSEVAAMSSGAVTAAVLIPAQAQALVDEGKANFIFDPTALAEEDKLFSDPIQAISFAGLDKTLDEKRVAVERFVAAMREALALANERTPEELAELTVGLSSLDPAFSAIPADAWVGNYTLVKPDIPSGDKAGYISDADWQSAVELLEKWGVEGIAADDPKFSYGSMVDMSYYDGAAAAE